MDPTWSEARKKAYQNKETSPNQYYYRFNENPHEAKAGKWSKAEDELLIAQVREHGPKQWGILSKSIPGRVGYTCNKRYHELVAANKIPADIPTVPVRPPHEEKRTPNKITETPNVASRTPNVASRTPNVASRTPNVATPNVASKKRKHEHALEQDLYDAMQKVLDKHLRAPSKWYSIYMYVWTDRQALYPTEHPIYVGKTSDTLYRRDQQHRNNQCDPPYFDRELKTTFREATIQLIEKKAFDDPAKAKEWMDGQEYFWMKTKRTMRGDYPWGCNTNNARHWEASKAKLHARKLELVEELKALEMVLIG